MKINWYLKFTQCYCLASNFLPSCSTHFVLISFVTKNMVLFSLYLDNVKIQWIQEHFLIKHKLSLNIKILNPGRLNYTELDACLMSLEYTFSIQHSIKYYSQINEDIIIMLQDSSHVLILHLMRLIVFNGHIINFVIMDH